MKEENKNMSRKFMGCTDWLLNSEWFTCDEKAKRNKYKLTDKAPEFAKKSFELYKLANKKYYD
jgi:predicted transcriptional regulator